MGPEPMEAVAEPEPAAPEPIKVETPTVPMRNKKTSPAANGVSTPKAPYADFKEGDECEEIWVSSPGDSDRLLSFGAKVHSRVLENTVRHSFRDIVEGGPAQKSGIKPHDEIIRLNNMFANVWGHDILMEQFRVVPTEAMQMTVLRSEGDAVSYFEVMTSLTKIDQVQKFKIT